MKWSVLFAIVVVGTNLASAGDTCAAPAANDGCCTQQDAACQAATCERTCAAPLNVDDCFPACECGQELSSQVGCCSDGCCNGCDDCNGCSDGCCCGNDGCNCDSCCSLFKQCDACYCDRCCRRCCHLCEESTCDMYPHYAYYPMLHGYYYFRPYNYQHVALHKQLGPQLGEKFVAPYQTTAFAAIYRDIESGYDTPLMPQTPTLKRFSKGLPDLQETLNN